ncbi:uncharacterized protein BJX67DRAFT_363165 [Aspergillus lucknowensis]|uniref:Proline-rich protein n=1 Tax=Aspergillus lucknowensis TaxID=176173 RepID=A0ABR4LH09_9EURO
MSNSQFQLFPPPAPQGPPKNPFRKAPRRPSIDTQPTATTPPEDPKGKSSEANAVILQIVEPHSIKPPPRAHAPPLPPRSFTPELVPGPSTESPSQPRLQSQQKQSSPDTAGLALRSDSHDETSLRPTQSPPQSSVSPVVPIKSMFPQFNPGAPLSQQQYYNGVSKNFSRPRYRPADLDLESTPAPEIDRALGPKTVPADIHDFPAGTLDLVEIQYSSSAQLKNLWEIANGQKPDHLSGAFNLRMGRTDPATFVFGDPNSPFYTMQTYSTNELSLTRANPSIPSSSIPIMMLQLEDRRRREPPNDGLVSHLFSRLAAMLAIEQAADLARQHQLSPPDATEVEANALKRAAAQESCKLSWNTTKRVYELRHPSLNRQYPNHDSQPATPPALVGAAGIPLSPTRAQRTGALHVTVSTPSANPEQNPGQSQAPTILVTAPLPNNSLNGAASAAATPRTSTLPFSGSESDSDETLASLDLRTLTLSISASAISDAIPSLYAIDSVVAAVLAVAVSDASTNPVLADMPFYDPHGTQVQIPTPPEPAHAHAHAYAHVRAPTNGPEFLATHAERDDTEPPRIEIPTQTQTDAPKRYRKWWTLFRSKITQIQRNKRQKIRPRTAPHSSPNSPEEIDLEKYGIQTSVSKNHETKQEELPGFVRGLIKLFLWGLKLMFWALTVAFKILSWGLKLAFKCVTGEKA